MDFIFSCFQQVFLFFARAGAHVYSVSAAPACRQAGRPGSSLSIIAAILWLFSTPLWSDPISLDATLQAAVDKISDPKTQVCLPAIESLGRSEKPTVIPDLAKAFKSEKRALVRRYIVDALGQIRHANTLSALQLALKDSNAQVRQSAVAALGLLGTTKAQEILAEYAAKEKSPAVKTHLAHQLGYASGDKAAEALDTLQWDNDLAVQHAAEEAEKTKQRLTGAR